MSDPDPNIYHSHADSHWFHGNDKWKSVQLRISDLQQFVYDKDYTIVFMQNKHLYYVKITHNQDISLKQRILLAAAYTVN